MAPPFVSLNDGHKYPVIAFGTGTVLFAKDSTELVLSALKSGFNSIDTAQAYANTDSVGDALKQFGGKREDVYILSKWGKSNLPDDPKEPLTVLKGLLKELGTDYVDLYLIHSPKVKPKQSLSEQWKVMEEIKKAGLAKSVGVSNFREEDIEEISKAWEIPPAVNQIEFNPYIAQAANIQRLQALQNKHDIKFQAYGPLISLTHRPNGPIDSTVSRIAQAHGATDAQVLLAWAAKYGGGTVVTTTRQPARQKEYLSAFDVQLSDAEVKEIFEAGKNGFFRKYMVHVWEDAKP